jgi:hypothetical protein
MVSIVLIVEVAVNGLSVNPFFSVRRMVVISGARAS